MSNDRIVVLGVVQGYRVQKDSKSHFEDMRDACSVEDMTHVLFDEPYDKVKAAQDDNDLMAFVRDHKKQSWVHDDNVYEEVLDALNQEPDEEYEYVPSNDYWRLQCIQAVRGYCCAELAEEYIEEVEHQDGYGYWKKFNTIQEVIEDIDLYVDN